MSSLPTGTVTFLFTDIEGSTQRWDEHPDAMRAALERHDTLMRQAVEAQSGQVFKTVGDAFCVAFATAGAGLAAAIEAQRAIAAEDWSRFGEGFRPILVRMGLHTGEATERGGDYFGQPVNRVARIEAAGNGGQLLLSRETRRLVEAEGLPAGCRLRDLGEHRLKDLRHSERITQVLVDGLADDARPLRSAGELDARDRIQVLDANAGSGRASGLVLDRSVPETLDAIEASLRRDASGALLTAEQIAAAARHKPADWREHRLGRIAEWSQPRYRLDGRFIDLRLLIDQGEESIQGRWQATEEHYESLDTLLATVPDPAVVVLGPPGSGKSTLLRRLELDMAIAAILGSQGSVPAASELGRASFFVPLSTYATTDPSQTPESWLAQQWRQRFPDLPDLDVLLAEGRVTLLLDALNEIPASSERDIRAKVSQWKLWLQQLAATRPGNRVIFSCRGLDYSQPLSTPDLRVPQVRIEPLTDEQVHDFLMLYSPGRWREIWPALEGSPQLEVLRSPYFLALLVEQVEATGEMPAGRAALFTGFVRQALRRELERGGPVFESDALLARRDRRQVSQWRWKSAYDLPERGLLLPGLSQLAHAMQIARADGERSQVRIDLEDALDLLGSDEDEAIVMAGEALSVLDEDEATGELMYIHQLVQEYFAARSLAREPDPELARAEWRAAAIRPSVDEILDALDPADRLPPLAGTGWEETTILAAAMTDDPAGFLRGVMETNLALAGRAAAQPELLPLLPVGLLDDLRWALVKRSRDPEADLRDRIACGYALGDLGDPRFERRIGPHGEYLLPPLVEVPGGTYPIGDDEPIDHAGLGDGGLTSHVPRHAVQISGFQIGQLPVTNAEYRCFVESGGYEDESWWDTDDARRWRHGEMANEGAKFSNRLWRKRYLADPDLFEKQVDDGRLGNAEAVERWRGWLTLDVADFETALDERWRTQRATEPATWHDRHFNHPAQPVVGVCWYEARAYCSWLAAQTGLELRLPTEVEWEAAAGGKEGRRYPWGDAEELPRANTLETRIMRTTPVGVFVEGYSPEGVTELGGNVHEWTSSLFGALHEADLEATDFPYPYDPADGREDPTAGASLRRVIRGGGWRYDRPDARTVSRGSSLPDARGQAIGFRVVVASSRCGDAGAGSDPGEPSFAPRDDRS